MLGSFAERFALTRDEAARLACPFGGGIARTAQLCGAVSGALMVIGLAHGAAAATDTARRDHTYAVTKDFLRAFAGRHGSTTCRELLGVDIGTAPGREAALRDGLFKTRCPRFVRDAAAIVAGVV